MKKTILHIFILLFSVNAFAQTENQFLKAGYKAYDNKEYYEAIAYYKEALNFKENNQEALYYTAMSYYQLKDYDQAEKYFNNTKDLDNFPLVLFYKAMNYKYLGNYNEAINQFRLFNNSYPIPGFYKDKATQEIASCYWALDQKVNDKIKLVHFSEPINTGFSDFGAYPVNDETLQRTTLKTPKDNMKGDFTANIDFYSLEGKNKAIDNLVFPKVENDTFDYADGFYLEATQEFYYSKCVTEHELGEKICDLYVRSFDGKNWGKEIALPVNTKDFTETQTTAYVNDKGETVIYFVSNRLGGLGKLDIWTCTKKSDGSYTKAEALPAPINTIDNESTPYFEIEKQALYFSSEWHYGFGGHDIFTSSYKNGQWLDPENLGEPINSSANDQYYYPYTDKAFFASNRKGTLQLKGAACCYDVFMQTIEKAVPFDSLTSSTNPPTTQTELDKTSTNNSTNTETLFNDFLPAVVYFHNDEPNPKTVQTKTSLSYADCYASYQSVKEDYLKAFNKDEILSWFSTVDISYENLNELLKVVEQHISNNNIELTLEGYCSPLALNDYNINLAKRRIVSLENYILSWNNGVLKPFFDGGYLRFKTAPFGEEKAAKTVSDDFYNTKESIYNPAAAKERKVAVIAVEIH